MNWIEGVAIILASVALLYGGVLYYHKKYNELLGKRTRENKGKEEEN